MDIIYVDNNERASDHQNCEGIRPYVLAGALTIMSAAGKKIIPAGRLEVRATDS